MILIVESGASKTDWCAVNSEAKTLAVKTAGMNLAVMPEEAVAAIVNEAYEAFKAQDEGFGKSEKVSEIHFYAAGLLVPEGERVPKLAEGLDRILTGLYPDAEIEYASDLLDAARAVCGHRKGIAAILGTGSNSCLFDGEKIVRNVRSAGFILGDEGGGARLGKMFMSDFLKGLVPEPISTEFASEHEVDYMTVVKNVYRGDAPSKYLGSFAPWIMERYDRSEYVRNIVDQNFKDFIERCLLQYDLKENPVGIVGGFGYAHRARLIPVAQKYGITFSTIIAAPMEGLVEYHLNKK